VTAQTIISSNIGITMVSLPSDSDYKALFEAIAAGDEAAFEALFRQCRARVYALAFKWTKSAFAAEEITQDVFISVWTGRSHLSDVKDARAYFYTILYNKVSRYLKNEANKARIIRASLRNVKEFSNETEETVYANEGQKFINKAIGQLSPQKKRIYELNRREGKSYQEIAKVLELSPHTVKSHLLQAMKLIRNYLKDNALSVLWLLAGLLS
jgi:RNA polymerase sigma-70 factor (family 1)